MSNPCEPAPMPHHHGAPIVGRIHRHGTARVARRLQATRHGCLPGSRAGLSAAVMRGGATVAGVAVLNAAPSSAALGDPGGLGSVSGPMGAPYGQPVPIPEPSGLGVLLVAILALAGLRKLPLFGRRGRVRPA